MPQPTTVASDLALALACLGAGLWLLRQEQRPRKLAAIGMAAMAVAAGLGCLRYAGLEQVTPIHRGVSHLAGAVAPASFALVALALTLAARERAAPSDRLVPVGLVVLLLAWVLFDPILSVTPYRTAVGTLAVVLMLGLGIRDRSWPGATLALGALTLALAGLAIGSEGTIGPLLAIDVFHVVLALAHLLIAHGLVGLARGPASVG